MTNPRATQCLLLIVVSSIYYSDCNAYEPNTTHRTLSIEAAKKSVLSRDSTLLRDLGLEAFPQAQDIRSPTDARQTRLEGILGEGAFTEDSGFRAFNHFFDPTRNAPLAPLCSVSPCVTSPEWALARPGQYTLAGRNQKNSYADARVYFLQALTNESKDARNEFWGKTFSSVGQVMHHLQDMAQPQHVRNDEHCDADACRWINRYRPSKYESYVASMGDLMAGIAAQGESVWSPSRANVFATPRHFWTNPQGAGIAQYTNRNFVSQGTNFEINGVGGIAANARYAAPVPADTRTERVRSLFAAANLQVPQELYEQCGILGDNCDITFVGNQVSDSLDGSNTFNYRASSLSTFDQDLQLLGVDYSNPAWREGDPQPRLSRAFALNRFNHDAALEFLIPRAVAYSAGLIDYFFRGRLDTELESSGPQVGYRVKNVGPQAMKGTFAFYYDDADGKRYPVPNGRFENEELPVWDQANPATGRVFTFPKPASPAPRAPGEFMLVFQGDMGEERADPGQSIIGAVAAKQIVPKPELFVLALASGASSGAYVVHRSSDLGTTWDLAAGVSGRHFDLTYLGGKALATNAALTLDGGRSWASKPVNQAGVAIDAQTLIGARRYQSQANTWPPYYSGVVYSTDFGMSWSGPTVFQEIESIGDFVAMGQGRILAQGTRYANYTTPCPAPFGGITCQVLERALYHSSNSGASWTRSNLGEQIGRSVVYVGKRRLENGALTADAAGGDTLLGDRYLGAAGNYQSELVRSMDGGLTWEKHSSYPGEVAYYGSPEYWSLWHLAHGGGNLLFAYFHNGAYTGKQRMYKSADAGLTWQLAGELPLDPSVGVFDMTVKPGDASLTFLP